jgi:ABC-type branched-subunit amino acid transport system ATPase component/MFS family permease
MTIADRLRQRLTLGAPLLPLGILFGLNAVDELDRTAFGVLIPEIRDAFHLGTDGIFAVVSLVSFFALIGQVLIGYYADRLSRVRIALLGAVVWGTTTLLSGLAPTIAFLVIFRSATGIGRAVNDPTHNSLLADYYPPEARPSVYYTHRYANSVGQFIGPLLGGALAFGFDNWRAPFLLFWIPTAVFVVVGWAKLRDPIRGGHERATMGASDETVSTEEAPPSFGEAWRILWQVKALRRIWFSLPFFAVSLFGFGAIYSIFYSDIFGLNPLARGTIAAFTEPLQLVGIVLGFRFVARLMARDPGHVLRFMALVAAITAACFIAFAFAAKLPVAIAANMLLAIPGAVIVPGIYSVLSLAIPPRARSLGFAIGALWVIPGLIILPVIGGLVDEWGVRFAIVGVVVPVYLLGGAVISSAGRFVAPDIQKVRSSTVAQAEVLAARRRGDVKLLLVKDLDVGYDGTQVLFGVNFEVDEGEIVALLGTNGAGKTTLLKSISGLVEPEAGAIIFDGQDMSYAPANEVAARGVVQVPGGKGAFPSLTVEENLKIASWLYASDPDYVREATEQVLEFFPVLRSRWEQPAGNLSGGEQQMLTLGQAFITKPRLLMIDELSLGLAPVIVQQLLEIVKAIRDRGTTIILVEQSVNVALTLAETAYFMEKGEIRFHGPTAELLDRPDVLRSVFLEGAGSIAGNGSRKTGGAQSRARRLAEIRSRSDVLRVDSISRSFGGIVAVDDVTFDLREGEILGVIGPNGAGKTTLFDLISGYLTVDSGRIHLGGRDITTLGPEARARSGLGRSFQDARLFPALTVEEAVKLSLERQVEVRDPIAAALGLPAVIDSEANVSLRSDELIDLMGLGAFRDKFISELSTGSRRIVDLACILAHDPQVLLFDEPSSGIAQRETEALGPLLLRIREATGASLLVIEHDMPLVTSIADEMLALDLGRVVVRGLPADVVRHPLVVESYLGTREDVIARSGGLRGRRKPRAGGAKKTRARGAKRKQAKPAARGRVAGNVQGTDQGRSTR